jgi:hypothetical protein
VSTEQVSEARVALDRAYAAWKLAPKFWAKATPKVDANDAAAPALFEGLNPGDAS